MRVAVQAMQCDVRLPGRRLAPLRAREHQHGDDRRSTQLSESECHHGEHERRKCDGKELVAQAGDARMPGWRTAQCTLPPAQFPPLSRASTSRRSEAERVHKVLGRRVAAVDVHLRRVELVHAARDLKAAGVGEGGKWVGGGVEGA